MKVSALLFNLKSKGSKSASKTTKRRSQHWPQGTHKQQSSMVTIQICCRLIPPSLCPLPIHCNHHNQHQVDYHQNYCLSSSTLRKMMLHKAPNPTVGQHLLHLLLQHPHWGHKYQSPRHRFGWNLSSRFGVLTSRILSTAIAIATASRPSRLMYPQR